MADDRLVRTIRNFLVKTFVPGDRPESLPEDLDLIKSGILNSLAIVETTAFLEDLAGSEIGRHELTPDNVGSIAAMAAFVRRRRAEI